MATVMELMRELKHLGELKKAGQITPELEQRMAQLKGVLDNQMTKTGNSSPPRPMATPQAGPAAVSSPGLARVPSNPAMTAAAPTVSSPGLPRVPTNPGGVLPVAASLNRVAVPAGTQPGTVRPAATAAAAPAPTASRLAAAPKLKAGSSADYIKPENREKLGDKILEMEKKADAAVAAQKKRVQPKTQDEAVAQLQEISHGNSYTPSESMAVSDEYFGYGAGYSPVLDEEVDLPLIDPRAEDLKALKAAMAEAGGEVGGLVTPGGVFLDDFLELYTSGLLTTEPMFEDDADVDDPNLVIPGRRKVTVHMLSGEVKRGVIQRLARGEMGFTLLPQGQGKPESISMAQIKAIFVNLNPGATPPAAAGRAITVTFKDKRSVAGQSPDFGQGPAFTLIPPAGRQGVEKMIINQSACLEVR